MSDRLTASEAADELFRLYANDIYQYARVSLNNASDAKDVVQDVFLRAFYGWDRFRNEAGAKHWLFRIARNCITDKIRRKMTEKAYLESARYEPRYSTMDTLVELENMIEQLKPDYRQVVILRLIHDFTVEETASILGWPRTKVRVTMHRAAKQLRAWLGAEPQPSSKSAEEGSTHGL